MTVYFQFTWSLELSRYFRAFTASRQSVVRHRPRSRQTDRRSDRRLAPGRIFGLVSHLRPIPWYGGKI
jgi:hypothetical protein